MNQSGNKLAEEAKAFDNRMRERIQNGLVPDLRRAQPCDWFYNNPWRRPKFINLIYGEYLKFALNNLPGPGSEIFEVGSGLGHMALELARNGYRVTGIELSPYSIEVADEINLADPYERGAGSLVYENINFLEWQSPNIYAGACFFQTLHHFDNLDEVLDKVISLLSPNGRIVVVEPARDWFSAENALFVTVARMILSFYNGWHQEISIPKTRKEIDAHIRDIIDEYRQAKDRGEKEQSPLDNSVYSAQMLSSLRNRFNEISFKTCFAFLPRMIGGLRGESREKIEELADFFFLLDEYCVNQGLLQPGVFCFSGELKA